MDCHCKTMMLEGSNAYHLSLPLMRTLCRKQPTQMSNCSINESHLEAWMILITIPFSKTSLPRCQWDDTYFPTRFETGRHHREASGDVSPAAFFGVFSFRVPSELWKRLQFDVKAKTSKKNGPAKVGRNGIQQSFFSTVVMLMNRSDLVRST